MVEFNLAVERHTIKPPNSIPHQIFRLYGILTSMNSLEIEIQTQGSAGKGAKSFSYLHNIKDRYYAFITRQTDTPDHEASSGKILSSGRCF